VGERVQASPLRDAHGWTFSGSRRTVAGLQSARVSASEAAGGCTHGDGNDCIIRCRKVLSESGSSER
jgi:hypothetical protein